MGHEYATVVGAARDYQNRGMYREAVEELDNLTGADGFPSDGSGLLWGLWQAALFQTLGESDSATRCLASAVVFADSLGNRGFDAASAWSWLEFLQPPLRGDWHAEYLRGLIADQDDDAHELALSCYDNALAAFGPDEAFSTPFPILGMAAWSARAAWQHERAADYLRRALELRPDHLWCLVRLGEAYTRLGRAAEAAPVLLRAAEIDAGSQDPHFELGMAYRQLGDSASAASAFGEALRLAEAGGAGDRTPEIIQSQIASLQEDVSRYEALAERYGEASADLVRAYDAGDLVAGRSALAAGANPSTLTRYLEEPLLARTVTDRKVDWVELLVEAGADVNALDRGGWTCLQTVANSGATPAHLRIAEALLKHGAIPDLKNEDQGTALIYACLEGSGSAPMVELLVAWGADPNLPTFMGSSLAFAKRFSDGVLVSAMQQGMSRRR